MGQRVLIVDDDIDFSLLLAKHLRAKGLESSTAGTAREGKEVFREMDPDVVLMDVVLPDQSGVDLVKAMKSMNDEVPIIMVSGRGETQVIVDAMKAGASDYVQKPIEFNDLWEKTSQLFEIRRSKFTEKELDGFSGQASILGNSFKTKQLIREISKVANSDATVLLRGESGTGKSLVAEVIHAHSHRRDKPFVTVNCAAIPETLLESELFGHEKGAFTGAIREKEGKFELANSGTIFLDEIGDLSPELQVKILRVLQGREFERVGGLKTIRVDVRVIAATNRVLEKAIQERKFREDLFYRLNVLPLYILPLRERKEDIPVLARYFFDFYSRKYNKQFEEMPEDVVKNLSNYDWPGNIRELQNVIERAIVLGKGPQLILSDFIDSHSVAAQKPQNNEVLTSLKELEYRTLVKALEQTSGNISKVARALGISRDTVYRRLKKFKVGLKQSRGASEK
jgi:two-component system, NtrC family, response regulator AtoC